MLSSVCVCVCLRCVALMRPTFVGCVGEWAWIRKGEPNSLVNAKRFCDSLEVRSFTLIRIFSLHISMSSFFCLSPSIASVAAVIVRMLYVRSPLHVACYRWTLAVSLRRRRHRHRETTTATTTTTVMTVFTHCVDLLLRFGVYFCPLLSMFSSTSEYAGPRACIMRWSVYTR